MVSTVSTAAGGRNRRGAPSLPTKIASHGYDVSTFFQLICEKNSLYIPSSYRNTLAKSRNVVTSRHRFPSLPAVRSPVTTPRTRSKPVVTVLTGWTFRDRPLKRTSKSPAKRRIQLPVLIGRTVLAHSPLMGAPRHSSPAARRSVRAHSKPGSAPPHTAPPPVWLILLDNHLPSRSSDPILMVYFLAADRLRSSFVGRVGQLLFLGARSSAKRDPARPTST
jgi:hypothetical protein